MSPARSGIRATLVVVSGDAAAAREGAQAAYDGAEVEVVSLRELRETSPLRAAAALRAQKPDVFMVHDAGITDRPARPMHMVAAWVAGARHLCLLEPGGHTREHALRGARGRTLARLVVEPPLAGLSLLALSGALRPLRAWGRRAGGRRLPAARAGGPLRIVYLRSDIPHNSGVGGTETHGIGMVRALASLGHSVDAIVSPPEPPFDHPRIRTRVERVESIFLLRPFYEIERHLRFLWRAWQRVRDDPPDFYLSRHRRFDPVGALLALVTRRPLVLQHEGSEEVVAQVYAGTSCPRTLRAFERLNHAVATTLLCVSAEVVRDLVESRGVEPERALVAEGAVDTTRFRPGAGGHGRRAALGIPNDRIVVGFCGTFAPWHGVEVLVDAVLEARNEGLPLHCLLIGDGEAKAQLQARIAAAGATSSFTFTGPVPLAQMPEHLDACDILACPTRLMPDQDEFFGSPTKLFEYMAAGKAIVASSVGQISEVIRDGETGVLVEQSDAGDLANAIVRLARDPEMRDSLGHAARRAVVARGGWESHARAAIEHVTNGVALLREQAEQSPAAAGAAR